jgi:hypothetical protein
MTVIMTQCAITIMVTTGVVALVYTYCMLMKFLGDHQ